MGDIFSLQVRFIIRKGCNMQLLSREAELELLEKVGDHLAKRMELEKQRDDNWDLISRS